MRKITLSIITLLTVCAVCGCKKNAQSVVGSWIMPIEGQAGKMQGIQLEEDGTASSINMATLVYQSWEQEGNLLYLTVKSIGNGIEFQGIDTLSIEKLTTDSLILNSNNGYTLRYAKQQ